MRSISNSDRATIVRAVKVLSNVRLENIRQYNAMRLLRIIVARWERMDRKHDKRH